MFKINKAKLLKYFSFWPPFLGAGIKLDYLDKDFHEIKVSMKLTVFNKNYVNTHFGGSLYSMTDPFYMLMLMHQLGKEFIVWDKSALIQYKKPGKGKVSAHFKLDPIIVEDIKRIVLENGKHEPIFEINVVDESGDVVARVTKTLYVKCKK